MHSSCCCDGFVSRCCGLSPAQSSSSSTTEWRKCQGSLRQLVMEAWTLCGMLSMAGSQPRSHYLLSAIIHLSKEALVFVHVDFTTAPPWVCPLTSYKSIIALYCSIRTAHIFLNWCLWVLESFAPIVGRLNCLLPKAYISPPKKTQPYWINSQIYFIFAVMQVKIQCISVCPNLPASVFKGAILDNYFDNSKFKYDLTAIQVV